MQILKVFKCHKIMDSRIEKSLRRVYINRYQKYIACSYGYKLACIDEEFSKPFKES